MRKVVAGEGPVGIHSAQILDLELDERTSELGVVSEAVGKSVGLKLITTAQDVHEQLDNRVHGAKNVREEKEAHDDGMLLGEAKVGKERVVVDEDREEREDVEEVDLITVNNILTPEG